MALVNTEYYVCVGRIRFRTSTTVIASGPTTPGGGYLLQLGDATRMNAASMRELDPSDETVVRLLSDGESFVTLPPAPDDATVAVVRTDPDVRLLTAVADDGESAWPDVSQVRGRLVETDDGPRREFRLDVDAFLDADVLDVTDETGTRSARSMVVSYRCESRLERLGRGLRTWWATRRTGRSRPE